MERLTLGQIAAWRHPVTSHKPRARLLHIHGISEHSARHMPTFQALNAIGVEVVRFDLRGAGESGGRRQYIDHFSDYVADTARAHNWICESLEPLPLFLMGHSLGGAIALHFAAQYGSLLEGVVLSAPAYKPGGDISPATIWIGRCLVRFLPTLRLYSSSSNGLSRDPAVVAAYRKDPLSSHFNTLKQGDAVLKALEQIPLIAGRIQNPVFIAHGTADSVIVPAGSFEILQSLGSRDKELHYLPGGFHEPHIDHDSGVYFSLVTRWIDRQIKRRELLKD
jgi:acylglycerol lipase